MSDTDTNVQDQITQLQEEIKQAESVQETSSAEVSEPSTSASYNADLEEIVQARVQEALNPAKENFKSKMDNMQAKLEELMREKVTLEEEKRQAELKRMEEEGKHKEVAELRIAEMKAKVESLQKENTRLSRDHSVDNALRGIDFRSDIAGEMARDRILHQLVQDSNGQWIHKSGVSIREYVDHFVKDEDNSFLLKAKVNSGTGGLSENHGGNPSEQNKDLSPKEQLEALAKQLAEQGGIQGF